MQATWHHRSLAFPIDCAENINTIQKYNTKSKENVKPVGARSGLKQSIRTVKRYFWDPDPATHLISAPGYLLNMNYKTFFLCLKKFL